MDKTIKDRFVMSADDPDNNGGLTYSLSEIESMYETLKSAELFGSFVGVNRDGIDPTKVVLFARNFTMNDETLYCDIEIKDTPYGVSFHRMLQEGHTFTLSPVCIGRIDDAKNVFDCELISVDVRMT